jgi:hypothetical protein
MHGFYFTGLSQELDVGFSKDRNVWLFSDISNKASIFSNHYGFKCNQHSYLFFNSMIFKSIDGNLETMG